MALLLPRTGLLPVALLAVLKSGAAYVPVDPDYPPARVGFLLADAGATVTVTDRRNQERAGLDPGSSVLLDDPETVASIAVHPAHDLTDDDRSAPLTPAVRAGVRGVASRTCSGADLVRDVRAVASGRAVLAPSMAARLVELAAGPGPAAERPVNHAALPPPGRRRCSPWWRRGSATARSPTCGGCRR